MCVFIYAYIRYGLLPWGRSLRGADVQAGHAVGFPAVDGACVSLCVCMCVDACNYVCTYGCVYICIYLYIYLYISICTYVHICTYTYMLTYTYVYQCMYRRGRRRRGGGCCAAGAHRAGVGGPGRAAVRIGPWLRGRGGGGGGGDGWRARGGGAGRLAGGCGAWGVQVGRVRVG